MKESFSKFSQTYEKNIQVHDLFIYHKIVEYKMKPRDLSQRTFMIQIKMKVGRKILFELVYAIRWVLPVMYLNVRFEKYNHCTKKEVFHEGFV